MVATNQQLIDSLRLGKSLGAKLEQDKQQNSMGEILKIVSNNFREPNSEDPAYRDKKLNEKYKQINNPQKPTEGQLLGGKKPTYTEEGPIDTGDLAPDGSRLMIEGNPLDDATLNQGKFRNDARQRKIRNLVNEGATEGEKEAAKGKLKDQTDLPNFLQNINIKPQDLLKILQLIPAATGFNLQMADISDSIKRENVGGTLRDVVLPPAMKEYGKTPGGGYKNPGALLSIMKKLV